MDWKKRKSCLGITCHFILSKFSSDKLLPFKNRYLCKEETIVTLVIQVIKKKLQFRLTNTCWLVIGPAITMVGLHLCHGLVVKKYSSSVLKATNQCSMDSAGFLVVWWQQRLDLLVISHSFNYILITDLVWWNLAFCSALVIINEKWLFY